MRVVITDSKAIATIWALAKEEGPAPTSVTITTAKAESKRLCACGCKGLTASTWVPGHDAKHKSRLFGLARGTDAEQAKLATAELTKLGWPLPVIATPAPLVPITTA